jgi:outer membrane protein assembly factor BamB
MAVDASVPSGAWTADLGVVLPSPPATDGERVYVGGGDRSTATGRNGGRLVALTVEDGTVAWASRTNGDIRWRPTVATERVYFRPERRVRSRP